MLSCLPRKADIFSPARIFAFIWFFSIGLADLKFSRLQHEWSLFSWVAIFLGIGSFLVGNFAVSVLTSNERTYSIQQIRMMGRTQGVSEPQFFIAIIILSVLYFVCLAAETYAAGGLPLFSAAPERARTAFGLFGTHLFVAGMPAVLLLIFEYLILVPGRRAKKYVLVFLFFGIVGSFFFLLVRFVYVMAVAMIFAVAYYKSNHLRPRNVILVLASVAAMFTIAVQVREARYVENYLYVVSQMRYSRAYASFTGPYMYIVMNLENFTHVADNIQSYTYGYYTFDFLLALTGLKHWMADYFGLSATEYLTSGYNTFPFIFYYLVDFGLVGVALFPLVLGITIRYLYYKMRATAGLSATVVYACCFYVMAISFFTNPLTMLSFVFVIAVIVVVHHFIAPLPSTSASGRIESL